jgi:N-acylneuraminate cytidylyltransferase/CMP-N,N'-diacetyllegionaminic acid synthase
MNKKIIGIIPARGGSKGVYKKNIKLLAGKPLIAYTIEAGLRSKYVDRIVVSTENIEIAEISKKYGAEVIKRPKRLAMDDTPTLLVLQHVVQYLEEKENYHPDIIITLQPTSPLRNEKDIDSAVSKFIRNGADSVVSLCVVEHHPYWMKILKGNKVYPSIKMKKEFTKRQDLPKIYRLNGAVYVTKRDVLMKENTILGKDTRAIIMPQNKSVDVDTNLDFKLAEILIEELRNEKNKNR